jgi:hypothetical protein
MVGPSKLPTAGWPWAAVGVGGEGEPRLQPPAAAGPAGRSRTSGHQAADLPPTSITHSTSLPVTTCHRVTAMTPGPDPSHCAAA